MRALLTAFAFLLIAPSVFAENWPQWRGPRHDGISREKNPPVRFSKTENVVWRLPMPGTGGATPAIWGDCVFVTSAEGENLDLLCASTAGELLWKIKMAGGNKDVRGDEGNSAAPSPSTDGKHVWAAMANGVIGCYDFDGREVWKLDLQDRYGKFNIQFGLTSTPVLDGDRLYLQLIHGDGNPATREAVVACLDKSTGREIWKTGRPSDGSKECEHSYASPTLYRHDGKEFLVTHGADYVVAHRLTDGSEIWRCGGMNPKGNYNPTLRFVASPLAAPGIVVVPSAKNGPVLAISPDAQGDVTESGAGRLWTRAKDTPDVPSPLLVDGLLYLCKENGNLICMDAKTGEELYLQTTHRQRHRASPLYADGKIYLCARDGVVNVVQAGRDFKILATNKLEESISASPVFANGKLYLRTYEALYCFAEPSTGQ